MLTTIATILVIAVFGYIVLSTLYHWAGNLLVYTAHKVANSETVQNVRSRAAESLRPDPNNNGVPQHSQPYQPDEVTQPRVQP